MLYKMYIMIIKSISIKEEHEQFIVDTNLNLSRFVQKKIDEEIRIRKK